MRPFNVEVIYALPDRCWRQWVLVREGQTALEIYQASGLSAQVDDQAPALAIYGKLVDAHYILQAGDRIDVLRPLTLDPKTSRKERVIQAKLRKNLKNHQEPSASA
ncbi:MAG: RnfH family protein [Pseudomonadales bacterium]|nr:RnfH family protein [Pseudomonadales bacterium]